MPRAQERAARGGGSGKTPRSVGAYGSKRGKEAQLRRRTARLSTNRVQDALAEVAANRKWLEAELAKQIAAGEPESVMPKPAAKAVPLDPWREGDVEKWTLGAARLLIKDGYNVAWAVKRTGWGEHWFRDLVGRDGYAKQEWGLSA